jgi:dissimilatory sulfite reductase (desulfoviridin) alpha/beta subunit
MKVMQTEEILHIIAKPFILSGIYKDEITALTDLTFDYVRRNIEQHDNIIIMLKKKHGCGFDQFTEKIKNNTSVETEDDWIEWKGANEMRQAWSNANKII